MQKVNTPFEYDGNENAHCSIMGAKAHSRASRSRSLVRKSSCQGGSAMDVPRDESMGRAPTLLDGVGNSAASDCCCDYDDTSGLSTRRTYPRISLKHFQHGPCSSQGLFFTYIQLACADVYIGYHSRRQWVSAANDWLQLAVSLSVFLQSGEDVLDEPICQQTLQQPVQGYYRGRLVRYTRRRSNAYLTFPQFDQGSHGR